MPKVLATIIVFEVALGAGLVKVSSDYLGEIGLICCIPFLIMIVLTGFKFIRTFGYRPQENHLGVVYRFGRFSHFVKPDEWALLIPFLDKVHREVSLYMRTADMLLNRVELRDGLAVDLKIKVFFKIDLRLTNKEQFTQALKFEGPEWPEMVKTSTEDVVRNQIFLDNNYAELIGKRKNREIKQRMSAEISARMEGFGVIINENYGVMLVDVQPNEAYFEAVQTSRAATPIGEASLERLRPVLNALNQIKHEDARTALLLELASKIVEVDTLPEMVLSPTEGVASNELWGKRKVLANTKEIYSRQKQTINGRYPFAE